MEAPMEKGMNWLNRFVESLFFQPDRTKYWSAENFGLSSEEESIETSRGLIHTVLLSAYVDGKFSCANAKATVLYAHPCRMNLNFHFPQISWLCANGFNVFTYDPIGCGRSGKGILTLDSINADAIEVFRALRKRRNVDKKKIFLFGQDVGAYALLSLASRNPEDVRGIVVDSVWATNRGYMMHRYGPLIGHLGAYLMPKRTDPIDFLRTVKVPLALMLCGKNGIVPDKETEAVMQGTPSQREIWFEPNSKHMQCFAQPTVCRDYFLKFISTNLQ